ncbi:MAG: helix-turn-helix domain-containing protein [Acidobacteriota bacterium]|nr:helix-turn-helix domain-containing protein [Acidobacteriota bacterium]
MNGEKILRERLSRNWEQTVAAAKLKVSQPYLSLIEAGKRPLTEKLARRAVRVFNLPPTALPIKESSDAAGKKAKAGDLLASQLASLGYPKFSHLKKTEKINPAEVLIQALKTGDIDSRTVEALLWLAYNFADMDWSKIFRHAKLHDAQNRLGFLLSLARCAAETKSDAKKKEIFKELLATLDESKLLREDAFNRQSLTETEKVWLKKNRSRDARHWRVLSNLSAEHLVF